MLLTIPCNAVLQSVQGVPRIRSDLNPATWCVADSYGCCCFRADECMNNDSTTWLWPHVLSS